MKTVHIVTYSFFSALICIFSWVSVPLGGVPVTLGLMAILLTALILGSKGGVITVSVYITLGLCGLPVFSGYNSGFQTLLGPTGGYIWSYIAVVCIAGSAKKINKVYLRVIIVLFSVVICYFCGTLQFMFIQKISLSKALAVCVYPFVIWDIFKIIFSVYISESVRRRIKFMTALK